MTMSYLDIAAEYKKHLSEHGDSHLGVAWPKLDETFIRHRAMLGVKRESEQTPVELLDFGCGAAHLYDYMRSAQVTGFNYSGLDISDIAVSLSQKKYPDNDFYCLDVVTEQAQQLPEFDYIVCNGVFTMKFDMSHDQMMQHMQQVLTVLFAHCRKGLAFNMISKYVDWERDDLFHVSMDELAWFLKKSLSRHFVMKHDYPLWEYTCYLYKEPSEQLQR